jgi:hypothetical protein
MTFSSLRCCSKNALYFLVASFFYLFFCSEAAMPTSQIKIRSQNRDATIQIINAPEHTHNGLPCYVTTAVIPEYTQTFHGHALARCFLGPLLLGSDNDALHENTILIQGSQIPVRSSRALLADYFYLPPDFDGAITVNPFIRNFNLNLDFYI